MATNYPGSLDNWSNPGPTTYRDDSGFELDVAIANHNDAIEAIQGELGTDPAGAQATVKARLEWSEQHAPAMATVWPSGGWNSNAVNTTAVGTLSGEANMQYYYPWWCPLSVTLDRIGVQVDTGAASANARLALYTAGASGAPDALVADFGEIDCSSSAVVTLTISQAVTAGTLYWLSLLNESGSVVYKSIGGRAYPGQSSTSAIGRGAAVESRTYASGVVSTAASWASLSYYTPSMAFYLRRT